MSRTLAKLSACVALCVATSAHAQATAPAQPPAAQGTVPVFPNPGKTSMSKQQQTGLGFEAAAQIYQQMPVLPDSSPEAVYIRTLGQKLVATIPPEYGWPFEFHVVPQKEINAFALPGGQMFVNVGTITAAKNESELVGVMGHEMAHVYMQHSAKQASKAQKTSMFAGIANAILQGTVGAKAGGLVGQLGQMGLEVGAQGLMMKYSRNDESQADKVGTMILYKAGYNPQGMVDFFKTLAGDGSGQPPIFFSSHPDPSDRGKKIAEQITPYAKTNYNTDNTNFEKVRAHAMTQQVYTAQEIAAGAKTGQWASLNKQNGAYLKSGAASAMGQRSAAPAALSSLDAVLPSAKAKSADLGPMKIHYPENWTVTPPKEQGQFVTIAPAAGVTASGVGYGVLLNGMPGPKGQQLNIDEMTASLIKQIQQSNELEQKSQPQSMSVGGLDGRSTMLRSPSPFPGKDGKTQFEQDWLVTVPVRDGLIFMIFVAPEGDFDKFKPTYEAMVKSIQFK